jgi:clamp loader subunit|nr:MAG TPA: DNA polymerase accessory protein sliding clamp [Caudoviricetes sp.]
MAITSNPEQFLWVEKYRPRTIADTIMPERVRKQLQPLVDSKSLTNLMMVGIQGCGKTSTARALCEELGIDYILINCSENGNIDTIRTTVRNFASTMSLMGDFKCVIFDEADHLTNLSQAALRGFIEEFSNNCRFIFTANFGNKIIEPLKSRTVQVDLSFTKEEKKAMIIAFDKRVKEILKIEGIEEYDSKVLAQLIVKHFPDFRRILNILQNITQTGKLDASAMSSVSVNVVDEVYQLLKKQDFVGMRHWVAENPDNDLPTLVRMMWQKADEYVQPDSIPQLLLYFNQYQISNATVVDKEINLMAMLTEIMADVRFKA